MISASIRLLLTACLLEVLIAIGYVFLPAISLNTTSICNAQDQSKVRTLTVQFVPEAECPIYVTAARTELDLDPFGAPMDARTYVDYKNVSDRPLVAVKFRVGFYDQDGKNHGTFHAPDGRSIEPGGQGSQKWRSEKVDPRTTAVKMRVLEVRFADGSSWQSIKMKEVVQPSEAAGGVQTDGGGSSLPPANLPPSAGQPFPGPGSPPFGTIPPSSPSPPASTPAPASAAGSSSSPFSTIPPSSPSPPASTSAPASTPASSSATPESASRASMSLPEWMRLLDSKSNGAHPPAAGSPGAQTPTGSEAPASAGGESAGGVDPFTDEGAPAPESSTGGQK